MNRSAVLLALALVGCAAPPAATSTAAIASPEPSAELSSATASAQALDLEGRILIELDGLYDANANGTDCQIVYAEGDYCCVNRISPDRTQILVMPGTDYTGAVRGGTLSLDGSEFDLLPQPDESLNLVPSAWSPDGKRIAFEGWDNSDPSRNGIYSARASDLSDLVRITDRPGLPHDSPLDYSPDGMQLVFYRAERAEPDFPIDIGGSLWVVNVDGTDAHELQTGDVRPSWNARWSPDGSTIVFAEERLRATGALWTIRPDGTDLTMVFADPDGRFARAPVWSPDGSQIMFYLHPTSDNFQHDANEIYVVNADGSGSTLLMGGPGFKYVTEWWSER